jgi:dTDP-4-dehydrorhamnose reductase
MDVTSARSVSDIIANVMPDLVINSAGLVNLEECERDPAAAYAVNAKAVKNIASACRDRDIRFLHVSTDHYFTGNGDRLHNETAPVKLVNEYARTKYAGEGFALASQDTLVVRTNITGIRGWQGRPTFFEWAVESLLMRAPMALFDDFFTSTIDAGTCARAMLDLVQAEATGLVNVASRRAIDKKGFVGALAKAINIDLDWAKTRSVRTLKVRRAESLGLDVSRAEAILGYELPDVSQVVASLIADWRERHAVRH